MKTTLELLNELESLPSTGIKSLDNDIYSFKANQVFKRIMEELEIPPIPEDAKTCGFCIRPCENDWCCMKDKK